MALSQLFWDVLMPWNLKSTYFSLKMIHFLSLNIWYVIYVVFWIKILKFETSTSLHSVFIHNLYSVPTVLESGLYDVLPSPANLHCWGMASTPACQLCQKSGTLEHILSACPKALGEGRYRWCHDQVLRSLADTISTAIQDSKNLHAPRQYIFFIRARGRF